jgi:catechol 2,3-dioxygenase-like lactoylglutathione lyase family enzyme
MIHPSYLLLYVKSPEDSARFYGALLDVEPVEASATFALFVLNSGLKLGLWARDTVAPAPAAPAGGSEIGFSLANDKAVDETFTDWKARGVRMILEPTTLEFGHSFVALDPDGHRMRVYALADG